MNKKNKEAIGSTEAELMSLSDVERALVERYVPVCKRPGREGIRAKPTLVLVGLAGRRRD